MEMVNHSLKWVIFFVGLLASWLSFSGILPFFILPLIWLAAFAFLAVKNSYLRYFVILFSSWVFLPSATFINTTQQYFDGKAVFYQEELTAPEALNLDRKFRVWTEKKDRAIWGGENLVSVTNNFTVRLWVTIHGYQRGAYPGFYPDQYHAAQIIKTKGKIVPFEKPSTTIRLTLDTGTYEIIDSKYINGDSLSACRRAKVWLVGRELLLMQPLTSTRPGPLYLVEFQTGTTIARYYDSDKAQQTEDKTTRRRLNK
jgi:hypothetical protein